MLNRTVAAWAALILALLALAFAEQDRPWKRLQAEHHDLELTRLRAELDADRRKATESDRRLEGELEAARQAFEGNREATNRLEKDLRKARHATRWAKAALERLQAQAHADGSPTDSEIRQARQRLEERQSTLTELETELGHLRSDLDEIETRRGRQSQPRESLEKRIAALERGAFLRRIPGLRGLDPSLSVIETAPPGLVVETPGGRVQRVDRCMTCHPVASHPGRLVGEDRSHPPNRFGCTACHGGNGRATDFSRAGHWPAEAGQEADWTGRWGFAREKLPRELILPPAFVAAGCVECHDGEPHVDEPASRAPASPELGRQLMLRMGCDGCHSAERPAAERGPPLERLAAKTTAAWTYHWIAAPRRLRPTTWMPHLLPPDMDEARKAAVLHAMVRFLFAPSSFDDGEVPPEGDAEAGDRLFASIGCRGCHVLEAGATRDSVALERLHGPSLSGLGDKLRPGWLYGWLREPRTHRPDTPMPNLRLTEQEAADLTAFLTAQRDKGLDLSMPRVDTAARDAQVLEHLEQELSLADSAARFERMGRDEKDLYLGMRSLQTYGCHGCHRIPGLEDASPVAGTLAGLGDDPADLLADPSSVTLAHHDLPATGPRPDYAMSRREAEAVKARLLSLRSPVAQPPRRARQGESSRLLAEGRRLLEHYGCLGCHRIDGHGGAIAAAGRQNLRPPDLSQAGARLQSSWLYDYLHDPGAFARRPWSDLRMPSFSLPANEADVLVRFLAAYSGEQLFTAPPPDSSLKDREVGRAVMTMLQCQSCHVDTPEAEGRLASELAPTYRGASRRLRPDWMVRWILDPESLDPETVMPVTFTEDDVSYLTATISAPMFIPQRQRLMSLFESEAELLAYLSDSRQVAMAIRDYLWSLAE